MATTLTPEQRIDLQQHGNKPVPVIDPESNAVYFLVAGETFERLKFLLDEEPFDPRDSYAAQESALSEIWNDPALDVYNNYPAPDSPK